MGELKIKEALQERLIDYNDEDALLFDDSAFFMNLSSQIAYAID